MREEKKHPLDWRQAGAAHMEACPMERTQPVPIVSPQRPIAKRTYRKRPAASRFWVKVRMGAPSECWEWKAARSGGGYGRFNDGKRIVGAHRFAFEMLVGSVSPGLELDHLCRNTLCVNPAHLEVVTGRTNILRSQNGPAVNARKQFCVHGHPFTPENTTLRYYPDRDPGRECRTCRRERNRRRAVLR